MRHYLSMTPQVVFIGWLAVLIITITAFLVGIVIKEWISAIRTWFSRKRAIERDSNIIHEM